MLIMDLRASSSDGWEVSNVHARPSSDAVRRRGVVVWLSRECFWNLTFVTSSVCAST